MAERLIRRVQASAPQEVEHVAKARAVAIDEDAAAGVALPRPVAAEHGVEEGAWALARQRLYVWQWSWLP